MQLYNVQRRIKAHLKAIEASYAQGHDCTHDDHHLPQVTAIDLATWKATYRKMAQDLADGKVSKNDIDPGYIQRTYDELNKGAAKGYGVQYEVYDPTKDKQSLVNGRVLQMKRNLYKFAAAKSKASMEEINNALYDGGRLKTFEEYKADLDRLNVQYNLNYLRAEYNTALQASHTAKAWEAFGHNKKRFPNLEYRTQGDDRVRQEHEKLNGFIAPMDDPIWDSIAPPSGWNCFVPDTKILTKEGWVAISQIQRGNFLIGGSGNLRFVGDVIINDFDGDIITLSTKWESVTCTPNHRLLTRHGWVTAEDIRTGDLTIQVGKTSFIHKLLNAIYNTKTLLQYALMSFKRKREPITSFNVNN